MSDAYIVTASVLDKHKDNEGDALAMAKAIAADPSNPATHVYVWKLVAEVDSKDPLQLEVKHYGH